MKAKVIKTGEIIEVREWRGTSDVVYSTPDMNKFYAEDELEFLPDTPEEVLYGWVARNATGKLIYFKGDNPPQRADWRSAPKQWLGSASPVNGLFVLPKEYFPEVTWESQPKRVKITITPME